MCLAGYALAAAGEDQDVRVASPTLRPKPISGLEAKRKISRPATVQDKMDRRNFNVAADIDENDLLDDEDSRTLTYSLLNYGKLYLNLFKGKNKRLIKLAWTLGFYLFTLCFFLFLFEYRKFLLTK